MKNEDAVETKKFLLKKFKPRFYCNNHANDYSAVEKLNT